jgi:hypothetical protein
MAQIAVAPYVKKDAVITIGTDSYEKHVSSASLTPSTEVVKWQGCTPSATFVDQTTPTWTWQLEYAQDWGTTNALAAYLLANAGTQKTCVYSPQGTTVGKPKFTFDVMISPGQIGGQVNTVQLGSVQLGVIGQPVKSAW